MNKKTKWIKLL